MIEISHLYKNYGKRPCLKDISFTVDKDKVDEAIEIIERHRTGSLQYQSLDVEKSVAKVSVVGAGMNSHAGVAAKMFENGRINIKNLYIYTK